MVNFLFNTYINPNYCCTRTKFLTTKELANTEILLDLTKFLNVHLNKNTPGGM